MADISPRRSARAASVAPGSAPRIGRRELVVRVIVLGGALGLIAAGFLLRLQLRSDPGEQIPAVPNAGWIIRGKALMGGQPHDLDLLNLRDLFDVRGVVNLRTSGSIEGWMVRDFGMSYLWLPVPPGDAPPPANMDRIVEFMRRHAAEGNSVFLHDGTGLERIRPVAVMLLMAEGEPLDVALSRVTDATRVGAAGFTGIQEHRVLAYAEHLRYAGPRIVVPSPRAAP